MNQIINITNAGIEQIKSIRKGYDERYINGEVKGIDVKNLEENSVITEKRGKGFRILMKTKR